MPDYKHVNVKNMKIQCAAIKKTNCFSLVLLFNVAVNRAPYFKKKIIKM